MNRPNYLQQIREYISTKGPGTVFIPADFASITDADRISMCLTRLEKSGMIRRIMRGIYDYPEFSQLLNEYVAPDPEKVAQAIARNYGWTIIPCGDTALNLLGLSTQVPANWQYISNGPYKAYSYDRITITFKRTTNRKISGLSYKTRLVIQAIQALGKDHITDSIVERLTNNLSQEEKATLLSESKYVPDWIYSVIKQICDKD